MHNVAEGYKTVVVFDASGRFEPPPVAVITRLVQAGVILANAGPLILELMADNTHVRVREIYAALA